LNTTLIGWFLGRLLVLVLKLFSSSLCLELLLFSLTPNPSHPTYSLGSDVEGSVGPVGLVEVGSLSPVEKPAVESHGSTSNGHPCHTGYSLIFGNP
jgi:hypothetical protein